MLRVLSGKSKGNKKVRFQRLGEEEEEYEEFGESGVEVELPPVKVSNDIHRENGLKTESEESLCAENCSDVIDPDQAENQNRSEATTEEGKTPMSRYSGPTESDPLLLSQTGITTTYSYDFGTSASPRTSHLRVNDGKPHCCGVLFLCSLGAYASAGWNYIEGVNWSSQQQKIVARNAFISAFLYLGTLCLSLFCWVRTARNSITLRSGSLFRNGYERYRDLDE